MTFAKLRHCRSWRSRLMPCEWSSSSFWPCYYPLHGANERRAHIGLYRLIKHYAGVLVHIAHFTDCSILISRLSCSDREYVCRLCNSAADTAYRLPTVNSSQKAKTTMQRNQFPRLSTSPAIHHSLCVWAYWSIVLVHTNLYTTFVEIMINKRVPISTQQQQQ